MVNFVLIMCIAVGIMLIVVTCFAIFEGSELAPAFLAFALFILFFIPILYKGVDDTVDNVMNTSKSQPTTTSSTEKLPETKVEYNSEIKKMSEWFTDKGYEVGVPNDGTYSYLVVNFDKKDPCKTEFDQDIALQAEKYINKEASEFVTEILEWCDRPSCTSVTESRHWGQKKIAVYMDSPLTPDLIRVVYKDLR